MNPSRLILNITQGMTTTQQYKAWKFPGGEIHFKLSEEFMDQLTMSDLNDPITIVTRINSSDDLIFLLLMVDTITSNWSNPVLVYLPYMPYQQADRNFSEGECFSLKTICDILLSSPIYAFKVFDPHSDVTPALLKRCEVVDNSEFIRACFNMLSVNKNSLHRKDVWTPDNNLVILSPDAGAYKKIFKLCEKLGFKGEIENANKYRDIKDGSLQIRLSREDFGGKDILIIDDICIGGRTFIELSKALDTRNVGSKYLAVSHGIFSNGLDGLAKCFNNIFTTNSRRASYVDLVQDLYDKHLKDLPNNREIFNVHVFEVI